MCCVTQTRQWKNTIEGGLAAACCMACNMHIAGSMHQKVGLCAAHARVSVDSGPGWSSNSDNCCLLLSSWLPTCVVSRVLGSCHRCLSGNGLLHCICVCVLRPINLQDDRIGSSTLYSAAVTAQCPCTGAGKPVVCRLCVVVPARDGNPADRVWFD